LIEPLLPGKSGDPGRTAKDNRVFVNAVLFVLKTGIPWSDLPERYGNPKSAWRRFDRWSANGVWERIFIELADDELLEELEEVHLDSSTMKAHQVASTGRRHQDEKKAKPMSDGVWDAAEED
jgi:transposase